ncbi:hypothetical protein [Chitinimonas sp. BJYL2]|uniref:hypothetical protein n=1 Tax=Chitinimonas sp. BJYL2 TaxID=2976696 RepID=UPI0022B5599F|nr:hypothetical protein [Chitinimonas sp. BJYL2]
MYSLPQGVRQAILAIWITLAISALSALAAKLSGLSSGNYFVFSIIVYALLSILPYKLSRRSNPARHIYLVLIAGSYLLFAASLAEVNKIDLVVSILLIPAEVFIIYRLYQSEASAWFLSK